MDIMFIIVSVITAGALGFIFGGGLAYAAKVFSVEKNPKIEEVAEVLPNANCGACGYAGCNAYAEAVVEYDENITLCIPGGKEVADKIAQILGKKAGETVAKVAYLKCKGTHALAKDKAIYNGINDCKAAVLVAGGNKVCEYGCLGLGTCEKVCPFDAIHIGEEGLPVVDDEKCTGCGVCVEACPKNVLDLMPKDNKVYLACSSQDKGKTVKDYCKVGCISCTLCVKKCPVGAISMKGNLPVIDFEKCTNCGVCVHICPTKSYIDKIRNRSKFFIDTKCTGCTKCISVCPVKAISGNEGEKHTIDPNKCIGCGLCVPACPEGAIKIMGALGYGQKVE